MSKSAIKDMTPSMWKLGLLRGNIEIRQFMRQRESVVFTIAFPLILLAIFAEIYLLYIITSSIFVAIPAGLFLAAVIAPRSV